MQYVIDGRAHQVGSLPVTRVLPVRQQRMIGPYCFVDHMGPAAIAPGVGFDVLPHPHVGLSTVTYLFAGENTHRDSLGTVQVNRPGDVNVMTAGRGIAHSERAEPEFRARGGDMHGVQIWVALPAELEDGEPTFAHHPRATLPEVGGSRVLIGSAFGVRSPIGHPSDPLLVDVGMRTGEEIVVPEAEERGILVISGALDVGGEKLASGQLGVLDAGAVRVRATAVTRAIVLGGPSPGPRFIEWNFVATTRERIHAARDRWIARQFPAIPGDDVERVPWPTS